MYARHLSNLVPLRTVYVPTVERYLHQGAGQGMLTPISQGLTVGTEACHCFRLVVPHSHIHHFYVRCAPVLLRSLRCSLDTSSRI